MAERYVHCRFECDIAAKHDEIQLYFLPFNYLFVSGAEVDSHSFFFAVPLRLDPANAIVSLLMRANERKEKKGECNWIERKKRQQIYVHFNSHHDSSSTHQWSKYRIYPILT